MPSPRGFIVTPLLDWAGGLRFPVLFVLAAAVFVIDLFIPDLIPFVDEILLGLVTLVLGSWRRRRKRVAAAGADGAGTSA